MRIDNLFSQWKLRRNPSANFWTEWGKYMKKFLFYSLRENKIKKRAVSVQMLTITNKDVSQPVIHISQSCMPRKQHQFADDSLGE